jgi:hypothetical protein
MPARVYWDNEEKSIIVREMSGDWTWEEYFVAIKQVREFLDEVDHHVDIIVDCRETYKFPTAALPNIANANRSYSANMGVQVIVGSNLIVKMFAEMLQKVMPQAISHFLFVNAIEDAYKVIKKHNDEKSQTI